MKRLLLICSLVTVLLLSCAAPKLIPLKGNYPEAPMIFHSEKPVDEVWDRLIDIFAQKGLAIKIIDRSSGLIISENSRMTATIEDPKTGKLVTPSAFVVVPYTKVNNIITPISGGATRGGPYGAKKPVLANNVIGEWNVRIKKENTGTAINVNINNLTFES